MEKELEIMSVKKWENFKEKFPLFVDDLDMAIVKELGDKTVLVEWSRIDNIINRNN